MLIADTVNQISFLVTVCFSFTIIVLSLWFKNADITPRLFSISFFAPFLLLAGSYMSQDIYLSKTLFILAEPILLLLIFIVLIVKPQNKNFKILTAVMILLPVIIILICQSTSSLQKYIIQPGNILPFTIVILISNLYILKKENGSKSYLFWAVILLFIEIFLSSLFDIDFVSYLSLIIKTSSYIAFVVYFYNDYMKNFLAKIEEAKKKVNLVNRSLDAEVKKRVIEIERVNQNLVNISKIDSLTKVYNKLAIFDIIENLINTKPENEFCILMFDIDNFKKINDTLGHIIGDKCIRSIPIIAKSCLRNFDSIGRFGGDEFVIVLPETTLNQALQIATRLRRRIEETESPHYTISIGIAHYPKDGINVKDLIKAADTWLYKSKERGRNTISFFEYH